MRIMRIITLILIGFLTLPSFLSAKEVSIEDAKRVAKNFFYRNAENSLQRNYDALNLTVNYIETKESNLFYVFNIEGMNGFVITSAQDFTKPILGFSNRNNVDFDNLSPELRFMLDGYSKQIEYGINNNARATKEIAAKWQNLQIPSMDRTTVVDSEGPLLLTTWNQSPYYNDQCPTNSSGEHAVVGCVAVAMAQVMKYWNYPEQGTGSKTWYDDDGYVTDYSSINYSQETYEWNNMPISLSGENEDVAKLMYHCGQTVKMDWEVNGSGTQSDLIVSALGNYFGYSSDAQEFDRYYYTDAEWEQGIRDELDALRPIVYSGFASGSSAGHAWNCDGYKSDGEGGYLYHMNYGWGGYGNGYFALDNLVAGVTPEGDPEYFDTGHQMILGMYPASNYPEYCAGTRIISGFEGLFGDGSGREDYQNNTDCLTLVQPECARGKVSVTFERFELAAGDVLYLHNGPTVDDPVIATLDMDNEPSGQYSSTNNGLLIHFVTNGSETAGGWDAKYSSTVCGAITTTDAQGALTDGSGTCDYDLGLNCYFMIEPAFATQITINFTEFDLDSPSHDYVKIYDGETNSTLVTFDSSNPPTSPYVVNSSKAKVRFKTYSTEDNVGQGWALNYTSDGSSVGVDKLIDIDGLVKVYPNPFRGNAFVEIANTESKEIKIVLTDIVGKTIAEKNFESFSKTTTISLSDLTTANFEKGIYLLNIQIGNQVKTYKLISE